MRVRAVLLATALALAPTDTRAADLVVWWEEGFNPEEDAAVREIVAAFEHKTGKQVELVQHAQDDLRPEVLAAVTAGRPPDFLFAPTTVPNYSQWAYEGRLADLTDALGPLAAQFDPDALVRVTTLDGTTGRRGVHALPMGRISNHIHVWKSLIEKVGLTLADIPKGWEAFWSFWCEKAQPAVRKALGRHDIYGVGLPMSVEATDTLVGFWQFVAAYEAHYVTRDGRLVIDEASVRNRLIKVLDSYTALYRRGCVPPEAANWNNRGNNQAFLDQAVVMTMNNSLSIPNALKAERSDDYYKNAVTIGWSEGAYGQPLAIVTDSEEAVVFRGGEHERTALEFVHFLVGEGWLAHWLDFAGDRYLPPLTALLQAPFWLDPGDPHRMAAAMQFLTQPRDHVANYAPLSGNLRHRRVASERVWSKTVHRIVTEGISPEQAVDDAIARIKQILSE